MTKAFILLSAKMEIKSKNIANCLHTHHQTNCSKNRYNIIPAKPVKYANKAKLLCIILPSVAIGGIIAFSGVALIDKVLIWNGEED